MKKEFLLKICTNCGAMVEVLKDCNCKNCGIQCCGMPMTEIKCNNTDASAEKHLPVIEKAGSYIVAKVNHPMDDEHSIEWIGISSKNYTARKYIAKNQTPIAVFPYIAGSKVMAYCNKHGLWAVDVE